MKTFTTYLSLFFAGINFAQQIDSIKPKALAFVIKANIGFIRSNKIAFTDAQWGRMTPGFQVPDSFQVNPNGSNQFETEEDDTYNTFSFSMITNKDHLSGKKYRFTATIHLGIGPEAQVSRYWFRENKQVIDTLFSNQTGSPYSVYGTKRQDIQKYYKSKSYMVGIGERFALRPDRIFQFETGLDLFFLFAASSEVKTALTESYRIEGVSENSYTSPISAPSLNSPQITEYSAKMEKGLLICVPLDISFALSKKNAVLKRIRLGLEVNYGLAFQFTKGQTNWNESRSWAFNLRYEFYRFNRHFLSKSQKQAPN
jgi:hypothetical protein